MKRIIKSLLITIALTASFTKAHILYAQNFDQGVEAAKKGDIGSALRIWRPLAAQGDSDAQFILGVMYAEGTGLAQDYKEAVRLFGLAAAQGNPGAQSNLGVMYEKGEGVAQDYVRAHMWFNLGAISGDRKKALANRDRVAAKMTPAQIAEAQKLALDWKPTK